MDKKAATTYVQITREEFEEWLTSIFHNNWSLKQGTVGVYIAELSKNVGIEISSTVGSENQALSVGNAAMQMRLVSLITKKVLNKKAQGQSHFKRTLNWRETLKKAVENFKSTYLKSATFYEAIATIADRDQYTKDILAQIEKFPNWQQDRYLVVLHQKMEGGGVLMLDEKAKLDHYKTKEEVKVENAPASKVQPDDILLGKLRTLYKEATKEKNEWLIKFVESVGKQYKEKGSLSPKQMEIVEQNFRKFKIAKEAKKNRLANALINIANNLIASEFVFADKKQWTEEEWKQYKKEHPDTQLHPEIEKNHGGKTEEKEAPKEQPKKEEIPLQAPQPKVAPKSEAPKTEEKKPEAPKEEPQNTEEKKPSTKYPTKDLFKDDQHLPDIAHQPVNTKEGVYQSAQEAHGQMLSILDSGSEFEKSLGLTHHTDMDKLNLDEKGPVLLTAPLKGQKRADEKVRTDYGGDYSRLTDVVRASIAVDSYDDIDSVVSQLKKSGIKIAKKPKDRFSKPTDVGYRDVLLNVQYPNGHIGELQLHVKPMLKGKKQAHKQYEQMRTITAKMFDEKRKTMTPEEQATYKKASDESLDIYNKAWDDANASKKASAGRVRLTASKSVEAKKEDELVSYYELDGMPAYRKKGDLPSKILPSGKERVIYDLFYFDHTANKVDFREFLFLKKEKK